MPHHATAVQAYKDSLILWAQRKKTGWNWSTSGGRGKVQRLVVISNQRELEQHRALAPKASKSEGLLMRCRTMLTAPPPPQKKKKFGNTIRAVPAVVFQSS